MTYTPIYKKPYEQWEDLPSKKTDVTAAILEQYDSTFANIEGYLHWKPIPSKTSEITNDSGFVTNSVDNLTNYYKKSETYTKTEVKNLVSGAGAPALVFDTKADLDAWIAVEENVAGLSIGQNIYIKATDTPDYWWDGASLQILETEKVNLEGYVQDTRKIAGIDLKDDVSKEELSNAIGMEDKVDKIEGKGLSTNDYSNEEKEKVGKIMFVFGVENGIPYIEEL